MFLQAKTLAKALADFVFEEDAVVVTNPDTTPVYEGKRLVVVFPDMGSAAMAQNEWKVGTSSSDFPLGVHFAPLPYFQQIMERDAVSEIYHYVNFDGIDCHTPLRVKPPERLFMSSRY